MECVYHLLFLCDVVQFCYHFSYAMVLSEDNRDAAERWGHGPSNKCIQTPLTGVSIFVVNLEEGK